MRHTIRQLGLLPVAALAAGLLAATLVRLSPGFGVDERELDARFGLESLEALRSSRAAERDILGFYADYLTGMLRGDLGEARSLGQPISDLMRRRLPRTLGSVAVGLAGGWLLGLGLAMMLTLTRGRLPRSLAGAAAVLLCRLRRSQAGWRCWPGEPPVWP